VVRGRNVVKYCSLALNGEGVMHSEAVQFNGGEEGQGGVCSEVLYSSLALYGDV
jgi:hypothetical protein